MMHFFKYFSFSIFLILILSLRIKDQTIFDHIYSPLSTIVIPGQKIAEEFIYKGAKSTQKISTNIFKNSIPKIKDSVKASLAAPVKNTVHQKNTIDTDQEYINKIFKN